MPGDVEQIPDEVLLQIGKDRGLPEGMPPSVIRQVLSDRTAPGSLQGAMAQRPLQGANQTPDGMFLTALPNVQEVQPGPVGKFIGETAGGLAKNVADNPATAAAMIATAWTPVPEAVAIARWGPTLGRAILGAWRVSAAGGAGALAGGLQGGPQAGSAAGMEQAMGQLTGEALFGYGLPAGMQALRETGPSVQKAGRAVADWASRTKGGQLATREAEAIATEAARPGKLAAQKGTLEMMGVEQGGKIGDMHREQAAAQAARASAMEAKAAELSGVKTQLTRHEMSKALVENQTAAMNDALNDYAALYNRGPKGESSAEIATASRAAVENISGYGKPMGAMKAAADGALERKSRELYAAAAHGAQAFESSRYLDPMIDISPISRKILSMEKNRPKTLRMEAPPFDLGELRGGGDGPPLQRGEIVAQAATRGGDIQVTPKRPEMYAGEKRPNFSEGLAQGLNRAPGDYLEMVGLAEGQRAVNPSELMVAIGNAAQRIKDPDTPELTREALKTFRDGAKELLVKKLGTSPVGRSALDTLKLADEFYAGKQEFYKTAWYKLALKDPENLSQMLQPRAPESVDALMAMAKEARIPSLPRAVGRQLLDQIAGDNALGLADRMARWSASPGQGIPSTAGRLASYDGEFGQTWNRLKGISEKLRAVESAPGLKGDVLRNDILKLEDELAKMQAKAFKDSEKFQESLTKYRSSAEKETDAVKAEIERLSTPATQGSAYKDAVAKLGVGGAARAAIRAVIPPSMRYGAAASAFALHMGGASMLPALGVAALPAVKEGIGYQVTKMALRAAERPDWAVAFSRNMDAMVLGKPDALVNMVRLGKLMGPNPPAPEPAR